MNREWRFPVDDKEVIVTIDPLGVESVRVGTRIVSRSVEGGKPEGHSFFITRDPPPTPIEAGAYREPTPVDVEVRVRVDKATGECSLTLNERAIEPTVRPEPIERPPPPPETETGGQGYVPFDNSPIPWQSILWKLGAVVGLAVVIPYGVEQARIAATNRAFAKFSRCVASEDVDCASEEFRSLESSRRRVDGRVRIARGQLQVLRGDTKTADEIERDVTVNAEVYKLGPREKAELLLLRGDLAFALGDPERAQREWDKATTSVDATLVETRLHRLEASRVKARETVAALRPMFEDFVAACERGGTPSAPDEAALERTIRRLPREDARAAVAQAMKWAYSLRFDKRRDVVLVFRKNDDPSTRFVGRRAEAFAKVRALAEEGYALAIR